MTGDMTRGNPLRLMVPFAVPLLLSSVLQQLYGMFDSVIVGRLIGQEAFAAVGACAYLSWFPTSMVVGLSHGFSVWLAQRFGAKDESGFRGALASGLTLAAGFALVISAVCLCFLGPFLRLIRTPDALMGYATEYLRVMLCGLVVTALYNVLGDALRAAGDSRTPLMALVAGTVLNIALDYLLLAALGMGVGGAALATVISQLAALCLCARKLWRNGFTAPRRADWRPRAKTVRELLRLGLPRLLSESVTSTGVLALQAAVNANGLIFVTGMTAAQRYYSFLSLVSFALEGALATFVGQNAGARQGRRVLDGTRSAVWLCVAASLAITAVAAAFAEPLIRLFLPTGSVEAVRVGVEALRAESLGVVALGLLCLHRAAIQGMGNAVIPMLSGFLELALRLAAVLALPALCGRAGLYWIDAATWGVTALMLIVSYEFCVRRRVRREEASGA